jgi:hypothetical protein
MTNRLLMPDGRFYDFDDAGTTSGCRNSRWGNYLKEHSLMNYQENDSEKQLSNGNYYSDYYSTIEALRDELESGQLNTKNSKPGSRDPADILPAWIFCPLRSRSPATPIRFENVELNRISQSDSFSASFRTDCDGCRT